jgi:predicted nuclease of restriction endonuclease-like (RecB) superfamily
LLAEVKARIRSAQYAALRAVNKELVGLYWDIGRLIVERQEDAGHGAAIAERLADGLRGAFPGVGGFSRRNVFYMREFYLRYRDDAKVQPLVAQIGWSHNLIVLQRCDDAREREFYLRMTRKFGWSKNVLIHQIDNQSYEKSLLGQTNFDATLSPELRDQAKLAVKMDDMDAIVDPVPPGGGGGDPDIDKLSNIIKAFNDLFGNTDWKDEDKIRKVITEEIPARVAQDRAYQNAQANSDKQNAKLEHDKALNRVMLELLADHTELFKQYSDNPDFKRRLTDMVFDLTYHPSVISPKAPPPAGAPV